MQKLFFRKCLCVPIMECMGRLFQFLYFVYSIYNCHVLEIFGQSGISLFYYFNLGLSTRCSKFFLKLPKNSEGCSKVALYFNVGFHVCVTTLNNIVNNSKQLVQHSVVATCFYQRCDELMILSICNRG